MNPIPLKNIILADASLDESAQISAHQANNTNAPFIDYFTYFQTYFNAYLEDIYLPLTNIIFPYGAMSDPFDSALFEYIKDDFVSFEKKLESFVEEEGKNPDFLNASYEELLNMPVDEGAETSNVASHEANQIAVSSQGRDLNNTSSFGSNSAGLGLYRETPNNLNISNDSNQLLLKQSFNIGDQQYIHNINQPLVVPASSEDSNSGFKSFAAFAALAAPRTFTFSNLNTLLKNIGFNAFISGIEQDHNIVRDTNFFVQLRNGNITAADAAGHFTYNVTGTAPLAEEFTFFISNVFGLIGKGHAFISQIQDLSFDAPVTYEEGLPLSFSIAGSLLAGAAAAKGAVLSIIDVIDPDTGLDTAIDPLLPTSFAIGGEPGANTNIIISSSGEFSLTSTVISVNEPNNFTTPLEFEFVVSNGHGGLASAVATITPMLMPIVLDLKGEGLQLISPSESSMTLGKLTGSQNAATIGWVGEGNGILMLDYDNSHQLKNLNQISFVSYVEGAKSDLEGLAAFDTNHNRMLDAQDKDYQHFGVISNDGNYTSLAQLGIVSISLDSQKIHLNEDGNSVYGLTSYQTADGQAHLAADVGLGISSANSLSLAQVMQAPPNPANDAQVVPPPSTVEPPPLQPEVHALA